MGESVHAPRFVGRYAIFDEIASGGMATVFIGRLMGSGGFTRTVAIKRLHPQFAKDPEFVTMFLDEARLAARIRHPNVVPTLDVVASKGELFLVMEYIQGETLSRLSRALRAGGQRVPLAILVRVMTDALQGLHAAHEARDERGIPLNLVHRDVTPQNILVGIDGVGRLLDFGVAKAAGRAQTTRDGQIKGKLAYMAPEQLMGVGVSRQTDLYAAAVVLWELLSGERLFSGDSEVDVVAKLLKREIKPPSSFVPDLPASLDALVMKGLAPKPEDRFQTAKEMCVALGACALAEAPAIAVGEWVEHLAASALADRTAKIAAIESSSHFDAPSLGSIPAASSSHPPHEATTTPPPAPAGGKSEPAPEALTITMTTGRIRLDARKRAAIVGSAVALVLLGAAVATVRASHREVDARPAAAALAGSASAGVGAGDREAPVRPDPAATPEVRATPLPAPDPAPAPLASDRPGGRTDPPLPRRRATAGSPHLAASSAKAVDVFDSRE